MNTIIEESEFDRLDRQDVKTALERQKAAMAVPFHQRTPPDLHPMTQRPSRASMVVVSLVAFTVALAAAIYGWFNYCGQS